MTEREQTRQASGDTQTSDPEELRRGIEETRSDLGDTVEALAQKADVKAQFSAKVDERKEALRQRQESIKGKVGDARERVPGATPEDAKRAAGQVARKAEERPLPAVGVGIGIGLVLGWLIGRR